MHLRVGAHPLLALGGRELPLAASPKITKEIWRKLVFSFLTSDQIEQLAQQKNLEVPVALGDIGSFRALVSVQGDAFNLSILRANGQAAHVESPGPQDPAAVVATGSPGPAGLSVSAAPAAPRPVAPELATQAPVQSRPEASTLPPAGALPPVLRQAQEPSPPSPPEPVDSGAKGPAAPVPRAIEPVPEPPPAVRETPAASRPTHGGQAVELTSVPATHPYRESDTTLDELLSILLDKGGSDLHLHERKKPLIRVDGRLIIAAEQEVDAYNMLAMIETCTNAEERAALFARNDLDTSYNLKSLSRFRVNVLNDTRGFGMVLRVIPFKIPNWLDLGVPEPARNLVYRPHGLFLVTGPTGSGKSTTLASLLHDVNQTQYKHIITIEDPIEFVHNDNKSCVTQREVGVDTRSFADGVVDVLRQDPDLILVGEMRDMDTMANALLAAESGRLVLATLHTTSASQTVERIINVFPEDHQAVARTQLANSLVGILSQTLLPRKGGGRIAAFELMVATESIRNLIKENKPQMIQTAIETGAKVGMRSLDQHLLELVEGGLVAFEDAYAKCQNSRNFKALEAKLKGVPISALGDD